MNLKPIECPLCRIGKYPHFSYSGSGACDHCGAVWTYDEGDTLTEDSLRRLWEKVPRWIPVSERLPEDRQRVLAYLSQFRAGDSTDVCQATFNADVGWFETQFGCYTASHWMPMPEPPEVK